MAGRVCPGHMRLLFGHHQHPKGLCSGLNSVGPWEELWAIWKDPSWPQSGAAEICLPSSSVASVCLGSWPRVSLADRKSCRDDPGDAEGFQPSQIIFPPHLSCRWIHWESCNGLKRVKCFMKSGHYPPRGSLLLVSEELDQDTLISRWRGRPPASTWTTVTVSLLRGW